MVECACGFRTYLPRFPVPYFFFFFLMGCIYDTMETPITLYGVGNKTHEEG